MNNTSDDLRFLLARIHVEETTQTVTKTTFLEIFLIGYHFITARKVSPAISSLNVCENVTGYRYIITGTTVGLTRESRTMPRKIL